MKTWTFDKRFSLSLIFIVGVISFILPHGVRGEALSQITIETASPQKLGLIVGKSIILKSDAQIKRVSLGAPEIADVLVLSPQRISVTGKAPGVTNLTLWGKDDQISAIFDLEVSPDVSRLREMISQVLPEEKDIRVSATHESITLSGRVSNPSSISQAVALAEPYSHKKVVNLLQVESTPDVSRLKEALQQALPGEDIQVGATLDGITLSGTVSSKANLSQALALAESHFPKKVGNALKVEIPPSRFKDILHQVLPEEKEIKVAATPDGVILSGAVSSTSNLSQVLAVAETYFPGKAVNLLQVDGVQQVMLEVRVAEMSRSLLKRLGINFSYLSSSGNNFGLTMLNGLTSLPSGGFQPSGGGDISKAINAIFRFMSHGTAWTVFIDALKEDGLLNVLAEPTLITLSGKSANFLAGGEFPVPVPQSGIGGTGTITIEYKPFGVGLNFTPTVLSDNKISMEVAPEVSQLDFSRAVSVGGFLVPSLTTRRVSTVVELGDGQSFAIAGLLSHEIREDVAKFPVLGEIPILGSLFRSSSFQKNETELIVIVTPHLVKPLDMAKQTLPTDQFIEPNDLEFYLFGSMEGKENRPPAPSSKSSFIPEDTPALEGKFGHIVKN